MGIFVYNGIRYGCGSGIFFFKDHFFQEACKQHDIDYAEKKKSRKQADRCFLKNMLKLAGDNLKYKITAYLFYAIVRSVGGLFYIRNKNKGE